MAAVRHHGRTLIAGLVVLGVLGFVGIIAAARFELAPLTRAGVWFAGGFLAAHLVRRLLIDLETATLCVAAAVVIAVTLGIYFRVTGDELDANMLGLVGVAIGGSLAGALTARRPTRVRRIFAILGAGAAGLGAAVIGTGLGNLVGSEMILAGIMIAAPIAALLTALFADVEAIDTANGQALAFAVFGAFAVVGWDWIIATIAAVVGAIGGWLLGAAGGAFGVKLRPAPTPDLPAARQVR